MNYRQGWWDLTLARDARDAELGLNPFGTWYVDILGRNEENNFDHTASLLAIHGPWINEQISPSVVHSHVIVQRSPTDRDWNSPGCLKIVVAGRAPHIDDNGRFDLIRYTASGVFSDNQNP